MAAEYGNEDPLYDPRVSYPGMPKRYMKEGPDPVENLHNIQYFHEFFGDVRNHSHYPDTDEKRKKNMSRLSGHFDRIFSNLQPTQNERYVRELQEKERRHVEQIKARLDRYAREHRPTPPPPPRVPTPPREPTPARASTPAAAAETNVPNQFLSRDPYEVLGIPRGSSRVVIRKAYRDLSRVYHPDKRTGDPNATSIFQNINNAHARLTGSGFKTGNRWVTHVKAYAKKHNVSYREALSKAKASYKK